MTSANRERHLRRGDYVEMPWRNGGGVTFEIAREPASGSEFDWRLSLALIERSGPFSSFAGYQRAIALVSGPGCHLHGIEAHPVSLRQPGDLKQFSGGAAVTCDLISGTTCDFNLMVREPGSIVAARHLSLDAGATEPLIGASENVVFCLEGDVECVAGSGQAVLGLHDTFIVPSALAAGWRIQARGPARVLAFAWRNAGKP